MFLGRGKHGKGQQKGLDKTIGSVAPLKRLEAGQGKLVLGRITASTNLRVKVLPEIDWKYELQVSGRSHESIQATSRDHTSNGEF